MSDIDQPSKATESRHVFDISLPVFHPPRHLYAGNFYDHYSESVDFGPRFSEAGAARMRWEDAKHLSALTREQAHPFYLKLKCGSAIPFAACVGFAADHFLKPLDLYYSTNEDLNAHAWVMTKAYDIPALLDKSIANTPKGNAAHEYFTGLLGNLDHFNDDGSAVRRFKAELAHGLDAAKMAHREDDLRLAQDHYHRSLVHCAFACHFLTDCFSAGHLRTPRRAILSACEAIYGNDPMPAVHLTLLLATGGDVPCSSAQFIAALYALAAHNFDSSVGVRVQVDHGGSAVRYTAKGDGHTTADPIGLACAQKAVALARLAIFQTRFWGRCDYTYGHADDPTTLVPRVIDDAEAPILMKNGALAGWLWEQTAADRKPTTFRLLKLARALRKKKDEYEKLDDGHVGPVEVLGDS